jgi:hypothetical protein
VAGAHFDYRHTFRLFAVVGCVLAIALVARARAVPAGFGRFGYYRAGAAEDARRFEVRHAGNARCTECHEVQAKLHQKDAHTRVSCETCHGPGARHAARQKGATILNPEGKDHCLGCHRALDARPGAFPQIRVEDHFRFVGVKDTTTECVDCHNPHEPLFMDRDIRQARLHPLIQRCPDCHQGGIEVAAKRPAGHPPIFECNYCHGGVANDFATRPHKDIRCTACHIFSKQSDYAGRIVRDTDPRFCLLCHGATDFRGPTAARTVAWPEHRDKVAKTPADAAKGCVDCHRNDIHVLQTEPKRGVSHEL